MGSSNESGLDEAVRVGNATAKAAKTAAQIAKSAAKGASKGGVWGAVAGAAWGAREQIAHVAVVMVAVLMIPVIFIAMLPSLIFGGLNGDSASSVMNDNEALTENMKQIVETIDKVLDEGLEDVKARIAEDFATRDADDYEIINPYEETPLNNASLFLAQYCAAKNADWSAISVSDMEQMLREGKQHLFTFTYTTEEREKEAEDDGDDETDPEADPEGDAPQEDEPEEMELWYIYTIVYQGETYFADTIFQLSEDQKELAGDYAQNLSLFLTGYSNGEEVPVLLPSGFGSGAAWIQSHIDGSGNLDATARQALFGSAAKTHFSSSEEAAPYMRSLKIPIWRVDESGNKYESSCWLTVHTIVADDVQAIFEEIFNDPEKYPIKAVGGARFIDTLRHSWGCAIDINPEENCECNFRSGSQSVTCGYGWWPVGLAGRDWVGRSSASYHGSLSGPSVYSIKPGGSVVRAFAAHGWGWGGNGWYGGVGFDFMHFSVLSSGG